MKKCVQSVLDHTKVKSRLIIVDNDSRDPEVGKYLREISGNETVEIKKVFNTENKGFAAGMNDGLRLSDAPFVCLLNNDCVVTEGWLTELAAIAGKRSDIGLVNPQSNTFGSSPDGDSSIDAHASFLSKKKGKYVELGSAIGFACIIKREVLDSIGYLDEAYRGVCYEDTDFSARACKEGFISVMAEGAYVFHVEQASRRGLKGKKEVYRRNREIFENKWGKLLRVFYLDSSDGNKENALKSYEKLKGLARERAVIDMWIGGARFSPEELIRDTVKHANISIKVKSGGLKQAPVLWRVLTKKKKYDAVVADDKRFLALLNLLRPVHKAEIFLKDNLEDPTGLAGRLRRTGE